MALYALLFYHSNLLKKKQASYCLSCFYTLYLTGQLYYLPVSLLQILKNVVLSNKLPPSILQRKCSVIGYLSLLALDSFLYSLILFQKLLQQTISWNGTVSAWHLDFCLVEFVVGLQYNLVLN